jgi:predicted regulator of Ras-like GTPase activity (Roadblock/LC7/MglB family)
MVNRWLKEITEITGVEGALLVSDNSHIIEKIGTKLDQGILEQMAKRIIRIISAHNLDEKSVKEIELIWYNYRILAMSAKTFTLIIFCGSTEALSLLRITVNVVVGHLLEDKKSMKKINKFTGQPEIVLEKEYLDQLEIKLISKLQ